MRKLVLHQHTTLDGRIATADGTFWEPFPLGDAEQVWINEVFRSADTWVMGRHTYEAVVPWWETVAAGGTPADADGVSDAEREFAGILARLTKIAISSTLAPAANREVVGGDLVRALTEVKARPGGADVVLSGGPATVGPLLDAGLVDETLLVLHPAVITGGPRWCGGATRDLALRLLDATVLPGGCVALRHAVVRQDEP